MGKRDKLQFFGAHLRTKEIPSQKSKGGKAILVSPGWFSRRLCLWGWEEVLNISFFLWRKGGGGGGGGVFALNHRSKERFGGCRFGKLRLLRTPRKEHGPRLRVSWLVLFHFAALGSATGVSDLLLFISICYTHRFIWGGVQIWPQVSLGTACRGAIRTACAIG